MLQDLKWPSLQKRREKSRLCMMYKITNGQAHFTSESLKPIQTRSGRRGHEFMYERVRCKTELRNNTFVPKTIRDWNSLPQATVESATLDTFVSRVTRLQWSSEVTVFLSAPSPLSNWHIYFVEMFFFTRKTCTVDILFIFINFILTLHTWNKWPLKNTICYLPTT